MKTQQRLSVEELRKLYPPYTTIRLIKMFDEYAPSAGTIGTITSVDDAGTIHVKWETGSSLGLIHSIDVFEVIRYPQKAAAHILSLDGQMDEIIVLEELGNNSYLVDYRGVKCSAIFNPFNCTYYADDIYGIIKEKTNNG